MHSLANDMSFATAVQNHQARGQAMAGLRAQPQQQQQQREWQKQLTKQREQRNK